MPLIEPRSFELHDPGADPDSFVAVTNDRRRFHLGLALIGLVGLAVRWGMVMLSYRHLSPPPFSLDDNTWYWWQSKLLADGKGFANPFVEKFTGVVQPSAGKPPLFTAFLSLFHLVGLDSPLAMRFAGGIAGTAAVIAAGLLARRITGRNLAGWCAALCAAVYPNLWINDGLILSESLYAMFAAAVMWAAYRVIETPTWRTAALLGVMIGLATLTRSEGQILIVLMIGPVALLVARRERSWRLLFSTGIVAVLAAGIVISPWVIRNLTTYREPVYISIGTGFVLDVANCDRTYYGDLLGYTDANCWRLEWPEGADESEVELFLRENALDYISSHKSRLPVVVAARIGRILNVYRPLQGVDLDTFFERGGKRPRQAGLVSYYLFGAFAIIGLVSTRRRKISILAPLVLMTMVIVTAASSMPITRYRIAMEMVWVVFGGIGLDVAIRWIQERRRSQSPLEPSDQSPPSPDIELLRT